MLFTPHEREAQEMMSKCSLSENIFCTFVGSNFIVMHVISRTKLIHFWVKHPDSETPLRIWFKKVEQARWKNLNELKTDFPTADYVGNNRVVFDVKGNNYRIIVLVFFSGQKLFIRFIGTHAEYDKVDAKNS
jgi:mRNA interferase HigB